MLINFSATIPLYNILELTELHCIMSSYFEQSVLRMKKLHDEYLMSIIATTYSTQLFYCLTGGYISILISNGHIWMNATVVCTCNRIVVWEASHHQWNYIKLSHGIWTILTIERAVGDGERMFDLLQRWGQHRPEVRFFLRHNRAPSREQGKCLFTPGTSQTLDLPQLRLVHDVLRTRTFGIWHQYIKFDRCLKPCKHTSFIKEKPVFKIAPVF